jgi:alpha-tubulin suppressor-like RCC1 family protein
MKQNGPLKTVLLLLFLTAALNSFTQSAPATFKEKALEKDSPAAMLLEESFDDPAFPPAGWQNIQLTGSGLWARTTAGINPPCNPHSGAGMAFYNDYYFGANVSAMLITPALTLPPGVPKNVNFWMYRDNGWPGYPDSLAVYYNTAPGMNGAIFLGKVERYYWMSDWFEFNFPIPASVSGSYYVIFKANSNWGNDMFLDDVRVEALNANDVGVVSIISPTAMVIEGEVTPEVIVKNLGTQAQTNIPVKHRNGQTGQVFTEIVPFLDANTSANVVFPAWTATPGGPYEFLFYTDLPGDEDRTNDTLSKMIICTESNQSYTHSFAGGLYHSLSICYDKTVMAWGSNANGQLGDGTNNDSNIPVQVTNLTDIIRVAAGKYHSVAVKSDGTVWGFGKNESGQLGNGGTVNSNIPVQVSGLANITGIAAGDGHTLAIRNDSTVWAWGGNSWGQLGDGTNDDRDTPVQVTGISGAVAVAAGESFSLALLSNGTVMGWGGNQSGQLGNGTLINSNMPIPVPDFFNVIEIAVGTTHSVALKNDGTVWAWGYNYLGQIGNGTNTDSRAPLQAAGIHSVTNISAGGATSYAVKYDGTAWAWGWNSNGQLGNGTTMDSNTPVQVQDISDMMAIAGGSFHGLALKKDKSLFSWGYNSYGQLGNGTNADSYVPLRITGLCPVLTSLNETAPTGSDGICVFPNPSDGTFSFTVQSKHQDAKAGWVEILNSEGRIIHMAHCNLQQTNRIRLSGAAKGLYMIRVHTNGGVFSEKVMIN